MTKRLTAARVGAASVTALALLGVACRPMPGPGRPGGGHSLFGPPKGGATTTTVANGDGDAVSIDPATVLADPAELEIDLGDGKVTAKRITSIKRGESNFTWIGQTPDAPIPNVVVTVVNGAVAVHVQGRDGATAGNTNGSGNGTRTKVPNGGDIGEEPPVTPGGGAGDNGSAATPPTTTAPKTGPTTVDVLVVYNSQVAAAYGTGIDAAVQNAMDRLNKTLTDSLINVQVRLVKVQQVPDSEMAIVNGRNLGAIERSAQVAQLRAQYGADLVQGWGVYPSVCGQGYQPNSVGEARAQYGFSIINAATSAGRKMTQCTAGVAPAHEIGHNLSAGHDRITDKTPEPNPADLTKPRYRADNFGYIDAPHRFMDIMSYQSSCRTCAYDWVFSNPDITYQGFPVGRKGSEDNARNIRLIAPRVATFMPTKV